MAARNLIRVVPYGFVCPILKLNDLNSFFSLDVAPLPVVDVPHPRVVVLPHVVSVLDPALPRAVVVAAPHPHHAVNARAHQHHHQNVSQLPN